MNDEIQSEAERLYRLGFAILWLHPRSKRPVGNAWTAGPRKSWKELQATYQPGMNVGVRLGLPSDLLGAHLAVIDVDVKSEDPRHRKEAVTAAKTLLKGAQCPVVRSGRGNGSRHYYVATEAPFKGFDTAESDETVTVMMPSVKPSTRERESLTTEEIEKGLRLRPAWGVSLYSDGRQVVLPPSIHPDSGKPYRWSHELKSISDIPVLPRLPQRPEKLGLVDKTAGDVVLKDFEVSPVDIAWLPISEEVREAIITGTGVVDRSAYLVKAASSLFSAGLTRNEVLTVLTDPDTYLGACGYDHAQSSSRKAAARWVYRYTACKIEKERSPVSVFASAPLPAAARKLTDEEQETQAQELAGARSWRQDLDRSKEGAVRYTLKNLDLILSNTIGENVFVEDVFANRVEYGVDVPWSRRQGEYIEDKDLILVKRWLADSEGIEPSKESIFEATTLIADRCRRHPVREWLESLEWDGKSRINTWLKDYCRGRAEEPYLSEVSRKFLLAMVTRIFQPGCQWDYILVLEGEQGKKKSTMARVLAGDRWFMDNLPPLQDKDAMLNLHGKWLIELAELASIKHTDFNQVKAYISRRVDTVRPHYGRLKADMPRQSVFIGTVNEGQYFKDPTGNRRYWPVKVGRCDDKGLLAVRDQLFAEAMVLYRSNTELLMLSAESERQAKEAQAHRRVDDEESQMREALMEFLQSPFGRKFPWRRFKTRDLMVGANVPWGPWNIVGKGYLMNVAAQVLSEMGFERHKIEGQRYWCEARKKRGITSKRDAPGDAPDAPDSGKHENTDFF